MQAPSTGPRSPFGERPFVPFVFGFTPCRFRVMEPTLWAKLGILRGLGVAILGSVGDDVLLVAIRPVFRPTI
jgi:hypothetical protein